MCHYLRESSEGGFRYYLSEAQCTVYKAQLAIAAAAAASYFHF